MIGTHPLCKMGPENGAGNGAFWQLKALGRAALTGPHLGFLWSKTRAGQRIQKPFDLMRLRMACSLRGRSS
ncbi:hypothetical protein SAMN04488523_10135 [Sulfitobacter brevis]|uniref:Uncharacterized protein n=1 Tax=Sulfitobacter brevis TaxID=74348 RepID=A0A1I1SM87_9RHOB|nr:hypothetical protein SAMN04488523_10135 [Sulfitobacter brevis]